MTSVTSTTFGCLPLSLAVYLIVTLQVMTFLVRQAWDWIDVIH